MASNPRVDAAIWRIAATTGTSFEEAKSLVAQAGVAHARLFGVLGESHQIGVGLMDGVLSGLTQQVDDCLALEREVLAIVALTGRKQSDVLADIQAQAAQSLLSTLEVAVQMRRDTAHQAFIDDLVRRATTWPDFHAFVVEQRRYYRQRQALSRYRRWLEAKD